MLAIFGHKLKQSYDEPCAFQIIYHHQLQLEIWLPLTQDYLYVSEWNLCNLFQVSLHFSEEYKGG